MSSYSMVVRKAHIDTFGHVNNASYLEILEEARWKMISDKGYGLETVRKIGQGPVILEVHLKFLREIRLDEKLDIQTELLEYKKKIGKLRQIIIKENKEIAAEAVFTFGLFDLKARKLIAPTPAWRAALGLETL